MINWRNGKGGFVGGLKNIIRGVFRFAHAINSADPQPPTPDCYAGFIGTITDPLIDPCGFIGSISDSAGFTGSIDATNAGFTGSISDKNGFNGSICND